MLFEQELARILPNDLPNRTDVVRISAQHLALIVEANQHLNLTRIVDPREAAIKHILDSVLPWRIFADARVVLDAGTGAGFPGIPLAVSLPQTRFVLSESIQKKARFLDAALELLNLANVNLTAQRAEDVLRDRRVDVITARAVAPLTGAIVLFGPALKAGSRALLYKGPDAEAEIAEAMPEARKRKICMRVIERYELPDGLGVRTIVEMIAA